MYPRCSGVLGDEADVVARLGGGLGEEVRVHFPQAGHEVGDRHGAVGRLDVSGREVGLGADPYNGSALDDEGCVRDGVGCPRDEEAGFDYGVEASFLAHLDGRVKRLVGGGGWLCRAGADGDTERAGADATGWWSSLVITTAAAFHQQGLFYFPGTRRAIKAGCCATCTYGIPGREARKGRSLRGTGFVAARESAASYLKQSNLTRTFKLYYS